MQAFEQEQRRKLEQDIARRDRVVDAIDRMIAYLKPGLSTGERSGRGRISADYSTLLAIRDDVRDFQTDYTSSVHAAQRIAMHYAKGSLFVGLI